MHALNYLGVENLSPFELLIYGNYFTRNLIDELLSMRSIITAFISLTLLIKTEAQQKLTIPEFKNLNPSDKYPTNTVLSSYANQFDIVISLKCYSAWGPDYHIKMLARHQYAWYKIEINIDERSFDPYTVCYSTSRLNDSIGNILWDTIKQNHLFDMNDERVISFSCAAKVDTIVTKEGKILEVLEPFDLGCDMPEYEFEIITKDDYKKLYFYSPQEYLNRCKTFPEPKWFVNCISIFEKHLGK